MTSIARSLDAIAQSPAAWARRARSRASTAVSKGARARRLIAGLRRDPVTLLSLAIALAILATLILEAPVDPASTIALTGGFVALQLALARVPARPGLVLPLRFALVLGFVPLAGYSIDPGGGWPVNSLVIPTVALAAAIWPKGMRFVLGAAALVAVLVALPDLVPVDLSRRLVALAMASVITAVGSRWMVGSLQDSRDRLRDAQQLQRRRARQLGAVERVGQILAREGPTPEALLGVMTVLDATFGYRYPSIYLWDGRALRLGAQRNYARAIETFPTDHGVIGRVARTRAAAFLPDVTTDPDYVAADEEVAGEICMPMLAGGDFLGVLNVEMGPSRRLDTVDLATMQIVGDRVAAALALGRERQKLTERARLMDRLASFSRSLGRSLDPATVREQVAVGAAGVIEAHMVLVVLLDRPTAEYRIAQVEGGDPAILGARILPGEGITGRAIEVGGVVVDDHLERASFPRGAAAVRMADTVAAMAAPLITEGGVGGALSWFREDLGSPFTDQEREVAGLLASQAALAITNADLHHATELEAVTDALTGLNNRRYFDAAMARAEAIRRREQEADRRPRSAIMFDLDHFGRVNKAHGHLVGDRILEAFADAVRRRVRTSDLVARYGGEEFVVVLDGATRAEAVRLADEIREIFAGLSFSLPDGASIGCTVSAGCSALTTDEVGGALLIERADVGLAMAKASGRNRVVAA